MMNLKRPEAFTSTFVTVTRKATKGIPSCETLISKCEVEPTCSVEGLQLTTHLGSVRVMVDEVTSAPAPGCQSAGSSRATNSGPSASNGRVTARTRINDGSCGRDDMEFLDLGDRERFDDIIVDARKEVSRRTEFAPNVWWSAVVRSCCIPVKSTSMEG